MLSSLATSQPPGSTSLTPASPLPSSAQQQLRDSPCPGPFHRTETPPTLVQKLKKGPGAGLLPNADNSLNVLQAPCPLGKKPGRLCTTDHTCKDISPRKTSQPGKCSSEDSIRMPSSREDPTHHHTSLGQGRGIPGQPQGGLRGHGEETPHTSLGSGADQGPLSGGFVQKRWHENFATCLLSSKRPAQIQMPQPLSFSLIAPGTPPPLSPGR